MIDPVTGMMVVGLAMNAVGSLMGASAKRKEAEFEALMMEENAFNADRAAADAELRGEAEAGDRRIQGSEQIAEMRAAFGASGVDGSVGSAARAQVATRMVSEQDALIIRNNAAREAFGYRGKAMNLRRSARYRREGGEDAELGVLISGGGDTLEGGMRIGTRMSGLSSSDPYGASPGGGRRPGPAGGR